MAGLDLLREVLSLELDLSIAPLANRLPPFGTRSAARAASSARPLPLGIARGRGLVSCGAMVWGSHLPLSPPFGPPALIAALAPLAAYLSESLGWPGLQLQGASPWTP